MHHDADPVLVRQGTGPSAQLVRAAGEDAQREPGSHAAVVRVVVPLNRRLSAFKRFLQRFLEHAAPGHIADRRAMDIEGRARDNAANTRFPGHLRGFVRIVAAGIEKIRRTRLDQLHLTEFGGKYASSDVKTAS